jgi:hypothetical protein
VDTDNIRHRLQSVSPSFAALNLSDSPSLKHDKHHCGGFRTTREHGHVLGNQTDAWGSYLVQPDEQRRLRMQLFDNEVASGTDCHTRADSQGPAALAALVHICLPKRLSDQFNKRQTFSYSPAEEIPSVLAHCPGMEAAVESLIAASIPLQLSVQLSVLDRCRFSEQLLYQRRHFML